MKKLTICLFLLSVVTLKGQGLTKSFMVAERTFEVPESWTAEPPSSRMRKAQYKNGETEIVVFYFGVGSGGSVDANINRWMGQFKEVKEKLSSEVEQKKFKSAVITTLFAKGTYMKGPPFGQKFEMPNYGMRATIIECEGGPIFIKMTGPVGEVVKLSGDFDKMARSGLMLKIDT
tara:strand:+ start:354 stop:878 length:525 start_codon:yes stop_codon:yes gene_type:complete